MLNSPLIDLCVKSSKAMTEIHEVKMGLSRQSIYTAIGQLVTHASAETGDVRRRILVLPDGDIPEDLRRCIRSEAFKLRRFKLTGVTGRRG